MSNTLQITKQAARIAHKAADSKGRQLLEDLLGKEVFSQKITDIVSNFEDICRLASKDLKAYEVTLDMDKEERFSIYSRKVWLIAQVLNEGWVPDYSNPNQYKYYPYFKREGSGFGFSYAGTRYAYTVSLVGSRFATVSLAEFAGKTFIKEYNDLLNAQN